MTKDHLSPIRIDAVGFTRDQPESRKECRGYSDQRTRPSRSVRCSVASRSCFAIALILIVVVLLPGCSRVDPATLPPVPQIQTDSFPDAVRIQLNEALADVNASPGNARHNGRLGMMLQTYKQFPASEIMYQRARALDPDEFKWTYLHGVVLDALGQPEGAVAAYEDAIELDPDYPLARIRLAGMYADLGRTDEARNIYDAASPELKELSEFHFNFGRFLLTEGRAEEAVAHIKTAMRLSGNFGAAHYQLALAYRQLGKTVFAEQHFRLAEARRDHPADSSDFILSELLTLNKNDQPFVQRAKRFAEAGRFEEAKQFIELALERDPESMPAHASMIGMAAQEKDFQAVDRHFDNAVRIAPDHPKIWFNLGIARMAQQRWAEAKEAFEKSRDFDDTDPNVHVQLAILAKHAGKPEKEIEVSLRRAVSFDPDHQIGNWLLGELLSDSQRADEAIGFLKTAVGQDHPMRPMMYMELARAHARESEWDKAHAAITAAETDAGDRIDNQLRASAQRLRAQIEDVRKREQEPKPDAQP